MLDNIVPTEQEIAEAKEKLIQYKNERRPILAHCRKYNLPIPDYDPPVEKYLAPYLGTPFTRTKDGIVYLPYPMKRASKARYLNPKAERYRCVITDNDWKTVLADGFDKDLVGELIYSKYKDFDKLIQSLLEGVYDPSFKRFVLKAGYVTDYKSYERLKHDWPELLPFVITKVVNQFEVAYRKTKGSYTTFFQNAFGRILTMSYIDYCRSVHKEDFRYKYDPFKILNIDKTIDVYDIETTGDQFLFCNELYYYVLSELKSVDLVCDV